MIRTQLKPASRDNQALPVAVALAAVLWG